MQPTRLYIGIMLGFLAALLVGCFLFFNGMAGTSYITSDGLRQLLNFIDKPRYDSNLMGLVYSLTFLVAGGLFLLLVLLPNETAFVQTAPAPQPRRRPAPGTRHAAAEIQPPSALAAPAAAPVAEALTVAFEEPAPAAVPLAIDEVVVAEEPLPKQAKSIEEEVLTTKSDADLPIVDLPDSRYEETGEEDVVYGSGPVTDDSIWDFIQSYPDSAVKFLYRKSLENKPLSPTDEDIYRRWELRGMTRAKVREFVLALMKWKSLPDDFPHNIWRQLRDEIFEMQIKT